MNPNIPAEVVDFLDRYMDSVGLLELFLVLYKEHSREFSADEMAHIVRMNPSAVAQMLESLCKKDLVESASPSKYRYKNAGEKRRETVRLLVDAYHNYPTRMIDLIYSPQSRAIQSFADAFKFNKGEGDDR